jgi:transcriptional regulator GlxA family with amidase domain
MCARRRDGRQLVERFDRLIRATDGTVLRVGRVIEALGISERTLRHHCHRHWGRGPAEHIKRHRLLLVHQALLCGETVSVTRAAVEHGFNELGHFARDYRNVLGEPPSQTLPHSCLDRCWIEAHRSRTCGTKLKAVAGGARNA